MPFPICKGNQKHVSRLILRGKNYQRIKEHIKKKKNNRLLFTDLRLLGEIARRVEVFAIKSSNLSLIPGTHMIEGEN